MSTDQMKLEDPTDPLLIKSNQLDPHCIASSSPPEQQKQAGSDTNPPKKSKKLKKLTKKRKADKMEPTETSRKEWWGTVLGDFEEEIEHMAVRLVARKRSKKTETKFGKHSNDLLDIKRLASIDALAVLKTHDKASPEIFTKMNNAQLLAVTEYFFDWGNEGFGGYSKHRMTKEAKEAGKMIRSAMVNRVTLSSDESDDENRRWMLIKAGDAIGRLRELVNGKVPAEIQKEFDNAVQEWAFL